MFLQMECLQPKSLNVLDYWDEKIANRRNKPLVFFVKRVPPQIFVQVSYQMYQALLLPTRQSIVAAVEVRYDGSLISPQQIL